MSHHPRHRVGILISGRGSNMLSLIRAAGDPLYPAEIVLVLSSRKDAPGLEVAREAGIRAQAVAAGDYPDRAARETAMHQMLEEARVELVCLAGYMHLLSAEFVERWMGRMLNIHPSLLPAFKGLDTHARALEAGCRIHGATVHFVTPELDAGPIIAQAAVPVLATDMPETLAERVLNAEHELYPLALALVASGRARMEDGNVRLAGPDATLSSGRLLSAG